MLRGRVRDVAGARDANAALLSEIERLPKIPGCLMPILLTRITGQVGSALRGPLASLGTVLAAERTMFDLTHPREIPGILDEMAPDLIVNPAAYAAVDRAEDERELVYRVNAEAPREMARWAAGNDVPSCIFDGVCFSMEPAIGGGVRMIQLRRCRSMVGASLLGKMRFEKRVGAILSFARPRSSHRRAGTF